MSAISLVYARQDPILLRNDLKVLNDGQNYVDTALNLGTDTSTNLRLSYNTQKALGSLTTNAFQINSNSLSIPSLPSVDPKATNNSYLLIDPSGNVQKGNSQFPGDINVILSHIQNDLFQTETTLNNLSFNVSNLEATKTNKLVQSNTSWIYIITGLIIFTIIGFVIFLILWLIDKNKVHHTIKHTHTQLDKVTSTLHEMSIYLKELKQQIPTQSSPPEFSGKKFLMSHIKGMV